MKKYLKDMNTEELKKIFDNNEKIQNKAFEYVFEDNMLYQEELFSTFFNNNYYKYLDIAEHYDTFYLKIKDVSVFFVNLNKNAWECLSNTDSKKFKATYKNALKYYNILTSHCNYQSDKYFENEEKLENECKILLKILEDKLHLLKNVDYNDAFDYFKNNSIDDGYFSNLYIENDDFLHVFEHIDYIKEW